MHHGEQRARADVLRALRADAERFGAVECIASFNIEVHMLPRDHTHYKPVGAVVASLCGTLLDERIVDRLEDVDAR